MATKKYDFSDWTGLTEEVCAGIDQIVDDSNPAEFTIRVQVGDITNVLYDGSLPSSITDGIRWNIYARVRTNLKSKTIIGIYIGDSDTDSYIFFNAHFNIDFFLVNESGTRCGLSGLSQVAHTFPAADVWVWLRIHVSPNDDPAKMDFRFYYNEDGGTTKPTEWTALPTLTQLGHAFTKPISEFGIRYFTSGGGAPSRMQADDLEISTIGGESSLSGLDANLVFTRVQTLSKITGGGNALITCFDKNLANLNAGHTFNSQIGKIVTIKNDLGVVVFKGESKFINAPPGGSLFTIICKPIIDKIFKTECLTNPVIASYDIRRIADNKIYDKDASFPNWANKLIVFERANLRKATYHAVSSAVWDSADNVITPDTESGDLDNLYFDDDGAVPGANDSWGIEDSTTDRASIVMVLNFRIFGKQTFTPATSIKGAKLSITFNTIGKSNYPGTVIDEANLRMWNFDSSTWLEIDSDIREPGKRADDQFGKPISGKKKLDIDLLGKASGNLTNFLNSIGATPSDFDEYELRIGLDVGDYAENIHNAHIHRAEIAILFNADQNQEEGIGQIDSNTGTVITLKDGAAIAWTNSDLPDEDGYSKDDRFHVTDDFDDVIDNIWANSGIDALLTLDKSITSVGHAELINLNNVYIAQALQRKERILNYTYWYHQVAGTDKLFIRDSYADSGVILTRVDWYQWGNREGEFIIDGSNIRTSIKTIGKNAIIGTASTTPEYTLDLFNEVGIIRDNSLTTKRQADERADVLKKIHQNAGVTMKFPINLSDASKQDYSALIKGNLVTIYLPGPTSGDVSIADYSGATKLLIIGISMIRTPLLDADFTDLEIMVLLLQLRET